MKRSSLQPAHWLEEGIVSLFVLVPTAIATIVAGVVNAHTYLVLGQQNCYASFVSSRLGYLDAYLADISVSVTVCEVTEPKSQG